MTIPYTKQFFTKLETLYDQGGYKLRYEKGNFKSGYCILETSKIIVVNKFASLDTKINILLEILANLDFNQQLLDDKNSELLAQLKQTEIKL